MKIWRIIYQILKIKNGLSKKTKIKNILSKNKVTLINNDTEEDNKKAKETILKLIKCQTNPTL